MLNGIIIGIVIGLLLGWRLHGWWTRSSIKKATDAFGSVTEKSSRLTKEIPKRAKSIYDRFFGNKNDKEKS